MKIADRSRVVVTQETKVRGSWPELESMEVSSGPEYERGENSCCGRRSGFPLA